jgi:manganese transport protein
VLLTSRRDVMGVHVNKRITTWTAWALAAVISALNVFLLAQAFGLA